MHLTAPLVASAALKGLSLLTAERDVLVCSRLTDNQSNNTSSCWLQDRKRCTALFPLVCPCQATLYIFQTTRSPLTQQAAVFKRSDMILLTDAVEQLSCFPAGSPLQRQQRLPASAGRQLHGPAERCSAAGAAAEATGSNATLVADQRLLLQAAGTGW